MSGPLHSAPFFNGVCRPVVRQSCALRCRRSAFRSQLTDISGASMMAGKGIDLMSKKTFLGEAQGRDIHDGKERKLAKLRPAQLALFQTFLPEEDKYSNTIEFYDAVPKYFTNKRQMAEMREGPEGREIYLPTLEREFKYQDITYSLKIKPARAEGRHGNELEYYPSEQEEIVEEALRKIACDRLNGVYLGPSAGVQFSMYELREELHKRGHSMSHDELRRSLLICRSAGLHIERKGGEKEVLLDSSIFPTVMISSRREWKADPKNARCYVQFNPLVTASIDALTYRQFDYETLMSYTRQLSRWFHKRLYHNYVNAGMLNSYNILLSTVKRDSGLLNNARISQDIKYLERVFEELIEKNIIFGFEKEVRRGRYNQIHDVLYTLRPSLNFVSEMKRANKRASDIRTTSAVRVSDHKNM
jgi:hypothetical protein